MPLPVLSVSPSSCPPARPRQPTASPLRWRPVHDDVDPQDLHGVEGVGQVAHGGQRDEAQGRDAPAGHTRQVTSCSQTRPLGGASLDLRAQLKADQVLDVMKNPLAFLHCVPAREEKAFTDKDGRVGRVSQLRQLLREAMVSRVVTFLLAGLLGNSRKGGCPDRCHQPLGTGPRATVTLLSEDCTQIILSSKPWDPSPHPGLPKSSCPSAIHPGEGAPTLLSVVAGPGDTVFIHHSRAGGRHPKHFCD